MSRTIDHKFSAFLLSIYNVWMAVARSNASGQGAFIVIFFVEFHSIRGCKNSLVQKVTIVSM